VLLPVRKVIDQQIDDPVSQRSHLFPGQLKSILIHPTVIASENVSEDEAN
jgi:hypothetical protein